MSPDPHQVMELEALELAVVDAAMGWFESPTDQDRLHSLARACLMLTAGRTHTDSQPDGA